MVFGMDWYQRGGMTRGTEETAVENRGAGEAKGAVVCWGWKGGALLAGSRVGGSCS